MNRPRKQRCCRKFDGDRIFKPRSVPMSQLDQIHLELGELEAMRLCDLEKYDQEAAGQQMNVSRGTVFRLVKSGRAKVLEAILESKALVIEKEPEVTGENK